MVAGNGDLNVKYYNGKFDAYQRTYIIELKDNIRFKTKYIYFLLESKLDDLKNKSIGGVIKYIKLGDLTSINVPIISIADQEKIIEQSLKINDAIHLKENQLNLLDDLIQSRFVELFGDFEQNDKKWDIVNLLDVACIDTHMTKDFEKYGLLPHIGIENIEKNTGKLINYISVKESNLTSGKYLFNERHIIYSKIRPNLNKVATPDFKGLCSADSYPILTNERCRREFLAFVLRSNYFLNYILSYSSRTNIPKVNKEQLSGFNFPLPPINLQNIFSDLVIKIANQKSQFEMCLKELEKIQSALMQEYFG